MIVALAGAAVALLLVPPLPDGPLGGNDAAPNRIAFAVDPDRSFSYGLLLLENRSPTAVRLGAVELLSARGGLRLVSAATRRMSDLPDLGLVANERAFPPASLAGVLLPLAGSEVPPFGAPGDGVELVLELRASGDEAGFDGLAVRYAQAGREYRATFPFALRVCTPRSAACRVEPPGSVVY